MKRIFNSILLAGSSLTLSAQNAITITAADVPAPTAPFVYNTFSTSSVSNPTQGANSTWDFTTAVRNGSASNNYGIETSPFFVGLGVDTKFPSFKYLNLFQGYEVELKFDFNANGVFDKGMRIERQAYGLGALSGNNADSMIFPAQNVVYSAPRELMRLPMTNGSAWSSISKAEIDFRLTVSAFGLNNVPCKHISRVYRQDTIVGWGHLSVYTANGPSASYDVLMDKVINYTVDSFYVGGNPAPAQLLNAFGLSQNQRVDDAYAYNFYRTGQFPHLFRIFYFDDATFTNADRVFACQTNTQLATGLDDLTGDQYATILFPNPSQSGQVNLQFIGKELSEVSYTISDLTGRVVQAQTIVSLTNNSLQLNLEQSLTNGSYIVQVRSTDGQLIASEKMNVVK